MQVGARPLGRVWFVALFAFAFALRFWRARQSLWGDEMESLLHYVAGPWRIVLAAGPGQYVPNDHVLYNALAKLCLAVGADGRISPVSTATTLIRLPSIVAGSLLPIAIAWPLRRRAPLAALLLGVVVALHPWMISQAAEARGYALMALLGVIATNLLPGPNRRWPIGYAVAAALALYAIPVALLLIAGHGAICLCSKGRRANWLRGAVMAAVFTGVLYAPVSAGLVDYYRHPLAAPDNNVDFFNRLPRFMLAGVFLPASDDPAQHVPKPWVGAGYWLLPVAIVVAGSVAARRRRLELWPTTAVMLAATAAGTALPLVMPAAGQVRFDLWAGLWLCVAAVALVLWLGDRLGRPALVAGLVVVIGWMAWADATMPPEQPVREAIAAADQVTPPNVPLVIAFFTAEESARLYGAAATRHELLVAGPPQALAAAEVQSQRATGQRPWLVVSYEFLLREARPDVWQYLNDHYRVVQRLSGRSSPVAIYAPKD